MKKAKFLISLDTLSNLFDLQGQLYISDVRVDEHGSQISITVLTDDDNDSRFFDVGMMPEIRTIAPKVIKVQDRKLPGVIALIEHPYS